MAITDQNEGLRRYLERRGEEAVITEPAPVTPRLAPVPPPVDGLAGYLERKRTNPAPALVEPEAAPFESGIEQLKATGRGLVAQLAAEFDRPDIAEEQLAAAQANIAEAQRLAPKGDARNPLEYVERVLGTQAPNLVVSGIGAALGRKLLGPNAGPLVGSAVTSTGLESGSIFTDIASDPVARENLSLKDISRTAAGFAVPAGAIDALPISRVFQKFGVGKAGTKAIRDGLLTRAGKGAVTNALTEGGTEGIQTVIERAAHKFANENFEIFGEEGIREILSAAGAGATLGGLLGPLEGLAGAPGASPEPRTAIDRRVEQLEADDELGAAFGRLQADGTLAANFDRTVARRRAPETILRSHVKEEHLADLDAPTIDAITKVATGEIEMTPAVRQLIQPRFNFFDEMIDQLRSTQNLAPENVEIEGTQSGVEVGAREDTGVFDEGGRPVRADAQAAAHQKFRFKTQLDEAGEVVRPADIADDLVGGSATLAFENAVHGRAFPNTSLERELTALREDDPNSEYNLVPLDEAVRTEMTERGFAPEAIDAELARRGQARYDAALGKLKDPEKVARLTAQFDPNDPAAFLKKFEVIHEQALPEAVQQGDEDVLTAEDLKADPSVKRKSVFDKARGDGSLFDGQFAVQDKETKRVVSAPRLVRRMLQKQGVKNLDNPTLSQIASAYAGGINALNKRGMSIKVQLPDNSTVAFAGKERVLFSDIKKAGQARLEERARGLRKQQTSIGAQARAEVTKAEAGRVEGGLVGQQRTEKAVARGEALAKVAGKVQQQTDLTDAEIKEVKGARTTIRELETKAKALEQILVRDLNQFLPSTARRIEAALGERNRTGAFTRLHEARDAIEKKARAEGNDLPKQERLNKAARLITEFLFKSRDVFSEVDTLTKRLGNLGVIHTSPRLEGFRDDNATFAELKREGEKETERAEVRHGEQGEITDITTEEITGEISEKPRRHATSPSKLAKAKRMVAMNRAISDVLGQVAYGTQSFDAAMEIVGEKLGPAAVADMKRAGVNLRGKLVDWLERRQVQAGTILNLLDATEGRFDAEGVDPIVNDPKLGAQESREAGLKKPVREFAGAGPSIIEQRGEELSIEDLAESQDPVVLWDVAMDLAGKEQLAARFTELQGTIAGWAKALGLEDTKIRLVMPADMKDFILKAYSKKNGPAALEKFGRGATAGMYIPGANVILISPFIDPDQFVEVAAHEFGHVIFANELVAKFTSTDAKDRKLAEAVVRDFLAWRDKHGTPDAKVGDIQASKKAFLSGLRSGATPALRDLSREDLDYVLDFNEWFADGVARALTAEGKPKNIVEGFFNDLIKKITEFLKLVTGKATAAQKLLAPRSVAEFLQSMYHDRRAEVMQTRSRPTEAVLMNALYERYAEAGRKDQPGRQSLYQYLGENVKMSAGNRKRTEEAMASLGEQTLQGHYARQASSAGAGQQHAPFSEQTREKVKRAITGWLKPEERRALGEAFSAPHVMRQLRAKLRAFPAVLARVEADPLEALSYGYQYWMAGEIDLGPKTQNLFQRFHDFIQEMFGLVSVGKEAENVLRALQANLDSGARDPLLNILEGPTKAGRLNRAAKFVNHAYRDVHHLFGKAFYTGSSRMYHTGSPVLRQLADMIRPRVSGEGAKQGMLEARRERIARFLGQHHQHLKDVDAETKAQILELLQNPSLGTTDPNLGIHRDHVRKMLRDVFTYLKSKGVEIGDIGEDYFPWVFSTRAVQENSAEFKAMLKQPHYAAKIAELAKEWGALPEHVPDMIVEQLMEVDGVADSHLTAAGALKRTPYMASLNPRNLDWMRKLGKPADHAVLATLFSKDLDKTIITYVHQAVKRAEFVARFGEKGDKLEAMFKQAKQLGATDDDLKLAEHYMAAVTGTLGTGTNERLARLFGGTHKPGQVINPALRLGMSGLMVVQNLAILSLATFTSLADPVGILVRGGSLSEGMAALKAGAKEMMAAAKGEKTDLRSLAEALGAIEDSATTEALEWEYGSTYLTPGLKWTNEMFFRTIGLTQWTRITRLMAVAGAKKFLEKHGDGTFNKHSKRYLEQLDLKEGDIQVDNGVLKILTREERESATKEERERDDRVRSALNRFVDESILRPDATQRPIWASDPHWMLVWHLKSFTYSFYEIILKRVVNELGERNAAPLMMLGLFVPVMMASDLLRELFTEGEFDDDKEFDERLGYAAERSGLTGLKQFLLDAQQDRKYGGVGFESFAGPTAAMLGKLPRLFSEDDDKQWKTFRSLLPYQNSWKHWIDNENLDE